MVRRESADPVQVTSDPPPMHPLNLGLRFSLELAALASLGIWGSGQAAGVARYGLLIGLPAAAATAWSTFTASPNRPSPANRAPNAFNSVIAADFASAICPDQDVRAVESDCS